MGSDEKLCRSEPNTLYFKAYYNLILQGFKLFLRLLVQCLLIARHCSFIARLVKL